MPSLHSHSRSAGTRFIPALEPPRVSRPVGHSSSNAFILPFICPFAHSSLFQGTIHSSSICERPDCRSPGSRIYPCHPFPSLGIAHLASRSKYNNNLSHALVTPPNAPLIQIESSSILPLRPYNSAGKIMTLERNAITLIGRVATRYPRTTRSCGSTHGTPT